MRALTARLLDEAGALYARAVAGVALLPANCRKAILAAALIYAEIGAEVARNKFDSVTARARVSGRRKLALLARAIVESRRLERATAAAPAAPCGLFLVEAVANGLPGPRRPSRPFVDWRDSFLETLQIFERLQRQT